MRINLAVVVVVALISQVLGQYKAFSADFQAVAPQWGTGYFTGKLLYDWDAGYMQLTFDNANGYTEFYQFNTDKGYNPKVPTGQFTYQYLYKQSKGCDCETTALQFAMPALWTKAEESSDSNIAAAYWVSPVSPPKDPSFKGSSTGVTQYYANPKFNIAFPDGSQKGYFLSNAVYKETATSAPVGFAINDIQQRTFTLTNVVNAASGSLGLKPPTTGCKCGKMLDIVLSLDRSGSIKIWQWKLELEFTKNLTNAFEYGPLKTNMGIVNWNANQWTTIDIATGTSLTSVQGAVNNMKCCPDSRGVIPTADNSACCCCGTPIGGGVWEGAYMLATSATRSKATKVLIVLTDGCQNHIWNWPPSPGSATPCPNCATEKACSLNKNCTGDITKWYNWATKNVPGLKIIAVGVGDQSTICTDQLMLAAGNDPTNVYNPQSWSELGTIVQTISATACTTNDTLCPDCCGICTCGVCNPAKTCYDKDKCNLGVVDPDTKCCTTQPVSCDAGPCEIASCEPSTGCGKKAITCPNGDLCTKWYCNSTSVICAPEKIIDSTTGAPPAGCANVTTVPQCKIASECDDGNNCTTDDCISGKCVRNAVVCQPDNACNSTTCKRTLGCYTVTKNCNDGNLCTNEYCDPVKGCVRTNVTCAASKDPCFKSVCLSDKGCVTVPIDLTKECNITVENCTVPACNGTCYSQYVCFTPTNTGNEDFPTTVVLSSALGGAAVAGIVIGAAVLAAGVGGGAAVAIAGAAGAGGVVTVHSNPVYQGAGTAGNNPLHKGN
jgi:hypothetical protein